MFDTYSRFNPNDKFDLNYRYDSNSRFDPRLTTTPLDQVLQVIEIEVQIPPEYVYTRF
jgi:hypothetical protein